MKKQSHKVWARDRERQLALRRQGYRSAAALARARSRRVTTKVSKWTAVRAPAELFLLSRITHSDSAQFVSGLRRAFKTSRQVCLDFRRTTRVVAGATLLFYAELSYLMVAYPNVRVRALASKDDTVNQVMEHLGVFAKLGLRSGAVPKRADVVTWRATTSRCVDGPAAGEIIEAYDALTAARSKVVFRAVSEAITNCVYHAYQNARESLASDGRWWMFCREAEGRLFIAVCDRGIGIPESLPVKYPREAWLRLVARFSLGRRGRDSAFVLAAIKMQRTRTGLGHRGKGLKDIVRVVDSYPGSSVYIFSNRALVSFVQGRVSQEDYKHSIDGTLIVWSFPIEEGFENVSDS